MLDEGYVSFAPVLNRAHLGAYSPSLVRIGKGHTVHNICDCSRTPKLLWSWYSVYNQGWQASKTKRHRVLSKRRMSRGAKGVSHMDWRPTVCRVIWLESDMIFAGGCMDETMRETHYPVRLMSHLICIAGLRKFVLQRKWSRQPFTWLVVEGAYIIVVSFLHGVSLPASVRRAQVPHVGTGIDWSVG